MIRYLFCFLCFLYVFLGSVSEADSPQITTKVIRKKITAHPAKMIPPADTGVSEMKSEKPSADSDQSPGEKPADIKQVKAEPEEKPLKKADAKHLVTEAGDKQEPGQEPVVSSSKGSKVIKKKITGQPAKILPPVKADTSDIAKKTKPSEKPAAPEIKATKPEPEKKSVSAPLAKKTVADEKDKAQKPVASSPKSQKAPAEPVARTDTDIKPEQTDASEKIKPAKSARADKKQMNLRKVPQKLQNPVNQLNRINRRLT